MRPDLGERPAIHEQVIERRRLPIRLFAKVRGRVRLWIEIENQDPLPRLRQGRGEVNRGRRLADAPLLVDHRDPSHERLVS